MEHLSPRVRSFNNGFISTSKHFRRFDSKSISTQTLVDKNKAGFLFLSKIVGKFTRNILISTATSIVTSRVVKGFFVIW